MGEPWPVVCSDITALVRSGEGQPLWYWVSTPRMYGRSSGQFGERARLWRAGYGDSVLRATCPTMAMAMASGQPH